jgi:hypothetical protein
VQQEILAPNPQADVRVYAVWTERMLGDARNQWDAAELIDPRVVHLWDERNLVGPWIVDNVEGYEGGDWDLYLLFGPDARWGDTPAPLVDSGFTVIGRSEELQRAISPLLADSG